MNYELVEYLWERSHEEESPYPDDLPTPCRLWDKATDGDGYGVSGKLARSNSRLTHRAAYELFYGAIPEGLQVLHRCDRTNCIEPTHLYAGTDADNMQDKVRRGRWVGKDPRIPEEVREQIRVAEDTYGVITSRFGVSYASVSRIKLEQP